MKLQCSDCNEIFDEEDADIEEIDLEREFGVGGLFGDHHYSPIFRCPECGSDDLLEYFEPEEEEDEDADIT